MEKNIDNFIDILHQAHCDNSKQRYYAEQGRRHRSIMPLTPFVYEFFIFNSLYQVDWKRSYDEKKVIFNPEDFNEAKRQREFTKFVKNRAKNTPAYIYRAFGPLAYFPKTVGKWTNIVPDARIKEEDGERFFNKIRKLREIVENCDSPHDMPTSEQVFELIDDAIYFIYLVRNNIFHGAKSLGDIYESDQKRRIEIYDLFLTGLVSLFFLVVGKKQVASDFVACPIFQGDKEIFDQDSVLRMINVGEMKKDDSRLIYEFTKQMMPPKEIPSEKSALFYPSSGVDMITPILLGLPYCRQFYFYEESEANRRPSLSSALKKSSFFRNISKINLRQKNRVVQDNCPYLEFEFDSIPRKIYLVPSDNKDFLKVDVELAFYFHRGDSGDNGGGEGGSGQKWDSELLPELFKKIPLNKQCVFLTDGEPGGLEKQYCELFNKQDIPFSERDRNYSFGIFKK